ncbi:Cationic amino acid transporter 1 [Neolecta irregularis DAH-3]|uniref:Cationic amino acid transporter 1 n=1 Tax=Neolecta irregularis (strain DAH-3) TaxID=1198029 RepID=A0A1U7LKF7_NEOID|nr:Cationic amino acid transporter 1 [Neolecta irregularis DAH-3]|eukprot:OLL23140.1 Cationic amino acid transporter 1 [Neolecta irregularis DAH-3]
MAAEPEKRHDGPVQSSLEVGTTSDIPQSWYSRLLSDFRPIERDESEGSVEAPLARKLQGRHMQMIAIGGSIGTGLFIGSGASLSQGGPLGLLLSFMIIGIMMFCVVNALGELAVRFPISGGFNIYSTRFIDPAWGFAMGWNYALQWLVVLPLELTASALTIRYWHSTINVGVWITIFLATVISINLIGVKGYGEAEFAFAIIKVVAVVGFILFGIIYNVGGTPHGSYIGGKLWRDPGPLANGFKGICAVFVNAAFAFAGTELVGLAAAEAANPRKSLPKAIKQVFWRITLFYIISLFIVGLIVPYTDNRLLNPSSSVDINTSPFVIAINNAGVKILPDIFNAVILVAVLSVGNSSIYASSRTLTGLADRSQAPKIFRYVDRKGRPLVSLALSSALGFIAYVSCSDKGPKVFTWLLALSGLSSLFTWGSICYAHIRFRSGFAYQGYSLDELSFKSQGGLIGSWIGLMINILCLIAQFYTAVWPIGGTPNAKSFFEIYLAAPIILVSFIAWKIVKRTKWVSLNDMDVVSGSRAYTAEDLEEENNTPKNGFGRVSGLLC